MVHEQYLVIDIAQITYGFTLYALIMTAVLIKHPLCLRAPSAEMSTSSDSIETDKWFHITYTLTKVTNKLYLNGIKNVQETNSRSFTQTPGTPQK